MKKYFLCGVVCSVFLFLFFSCGKDNEISVEDLYGYWVSENNNGLHLRFLRAEEDTIFGEYKYGYEWTENERTENAVREDSYHGNGWFKWKLVKKDLTELHLMDNNGAEIPKQYTVTTLTSSRLAYKDEYRTYSFTKGR